MNIECPYCEKLTDYNFGDPLIQTDHWIVFLAPIRVTWQLGSGT
jgi:hypothetical protein